jgi:HSP20 family protein
LADTGSGVQVDVAETDKELKVEAELPGIDEADIDVRVSDGMLVISGEKKADRKVDENGYILHERSFGRVERALPLPDGIDADAAQATFKNGILTVTIPKTAQAQSSAKRIPVKH